MTDLRVVATIAAKPGSEDAVRAALSDLAEASRQEKGCVSYELFESAAVPGTFVTIEAWRAPGDLEAHMQTSHVQSAIAAFGSHLTAPPAIHPLEPVG